MTVTSIAKLAATALCICLCTAVAAAPSKSDDADREAAKKHAASKAAPTKIAPTPGFARGWSPGRRDAAALGMSPSFVSSRPTRRSAR